MGRERRGCEGRVRENKGRGRDSEEDGIWKKVREEDDR